MRLKRCYSMLFFTLVILPAACTPAETTRQEIPITPPAISVTISSDQCTSMELEAGTQAIWTNEDTITLSIRLERLDESGNVLEIARSEIGPGDSFSTRFSDAGNYRFYCSQSPDAYGMITVK